MRQKCPFSFMTKVQHSEMNMRVNEQSKMINHFLEKQVEEGLTPEMVLTNYFNSLEK